MNLMFVAPGVAGGRVYADELIKSLLAEPDEQFEYQLYTRRGTRCPFAQSSAWRQVELPVSQTSNYWRTFYEYALLPRRVSRDSACVFHGLGTLSPRCGRFFVLTIHDLIYWRFPIYSPPLTRVLKILQTRSAKKADVIIVPSKHTAQEVVELLGIPEERLRIIPYGPGNALQRASDARIADVRSRFKIEEPFAISVARRYPHKNIDGLLRAWAVAKRAFVRPTKLVLVGEAYRESDSLTQLIQELGLDQDVFFTGFVTNEDLECLYSAAEVFVWPSLAEGLGLPPLEAMACGTPVVSSNRSAIPEAVGVAAILADPLDAESFSSAIVRALTEPGLSGTLREKGFLNVKRFSWQCCAKQTLNVYREAR